MKLSKNGLIKLNLIISCVIATIIKFFNLINLKKEIILFIVFHNIGANFLI